MMRHKIIGLFIAVLVFITTLTNVNAKELVLTNTGSISFNLTELETKQPIVGAKLAIYYIASLNQDSAGTLFYNYENEYKDCGILLDDPKLSTKLESVVANTQPTITLTTDSEGKASVSYLPLGLYYVKQINTVEGFSPCKSFLVTLPVKDNDTYIYDIDASPKTEIEKTISILIEKQWKAGKNTKIPQDVTVQLYKDDVVVKTAALNENNNWKVVYDNMPKSDSYYVKEINIPKGFTPVYKQNEYTFTVTNVSSLINTGQLVWPIPILACAGVMFIAVGFIVLRKTGKNNG